MDRAKDGDHHRWDSKEEEGGSDPEAREEHSVSTPDITCGAPRWSSPIRESIHSQHVFMSREGRASIPAATFRRPPASRSGMLLLAPAAGAGAHRHAVFWTRVFLFGASCVAGLLVARKRKLHRFHLHVLSTKSHDFGGFFGADIGGSLAKLVYFEPAADAPERTGAFEATRRAEGCILQVERFLLALDSHDRQRAAHRDERLSLPGLGGTIHFISFQTSTMERVVEFVRRRFFHRHIKTIACTGGGAFKFAPLLDAKLGIHVRKVDEMDALMRGLTFTLQTAVDECYTFVDVVPSPSGRLSGTRTVVPTPPPEALYPFLLVNIGSGVSILKVTGASEFERVSGSSLGGGTFWGLLRALSRLQSFDEAMDAAAEGDSTAVDMTVGDIYGPAGYAQFQLRADTVASSFGGSARATSGAAKPRDEDVARALLFMITQNLGQVAYLNARRVGTSRIYFSGNFLRRNETACRQLSYAIDFWSKSAMQAQFFRHEGYFGALGALVATRDHVLPATAVSV